MSWIRAMYSRRELVFSLVETSQTENNDMITFDDSLSLATGSSSRQKSTRRNASLRVGPPTLLNLFLCSQSLAWTV